MSQGTSLLVVIDSLSGKTHLKLLAGAQSYSEGLDFGNKTVTIIGVGNPIVSTNAASGPAIALGAGSTVTLQGLIIKNGAGSTYGHGVY